jgi:hypothetical protein
MGDAMQRLVEGISGASLAICLLFIASTMSLGSTALDGSMRHALLAFALATPLLALSALLAYVRVGGFGVAIANLLSIIGVLVVEGGVGFVLIHLDPDTGRTYLAVAAFCTTAFVIISSITLMRRLTGSK